MRRRCNFATAADRPKMHREIVLFIFSVIAVSAESNCSTWHYFSEEGHCVCGSTLEDVVVCNDTLGVVGVFHYYCLTSDGNQSVVGHCLVVDVHRERLLSPLGHYKKVFPTLSEQDSYTCGFLNRHGRLCGQCKPNTYVHASTYDMKCYPCTFGSVLTYATLVYLPLTIFLIIVVVFHISVTSPAMNVPVLCCQLLSLPFTLRFILQYTLAYPHITPFIKFFGTIVGIWNLDFFRLIQITSICLKLELMQLIALDLLVAAYPLLVLVLIYLLVTAHDRGCRLFVTLWTKLFWWSEGIRRQCNIRHSIIDAFATFLLLSYIKFLNTSIDLLVYSKTYNKHGKFVGKYLFNDPMVEFMSRQHVPYAIIAIVVLVGLLVPLLLLILYPMKWFQVFLNKCHLNSPGLRMFMECFQGYYRDRSDGGWECRYFAAVYPAARIGVYFLYTIVEGVRFYTCCSILCVTIIVAMVLVRPYKPQYRFYHKLDVFMLSSLLLLLLWVVQMSLYDMNIIWGLAIASFCSSIPILYFVFKIFISLKYFVLHKPRRRYTSRIN